MFKLTILLLQWKWWNKWKHRSSRSWYKERAMQWRRIDGNFRLCSFDKSHFKPRNYWSNMLWFWNTLFLQRKYQKSKKFIWEMFRCTGNVPLPQFHPFLTSCYSFLFISFLHFFFPSFLLYFISISFHLSFHLFIVPSIFLSILPSIFVLPFFHLFVHFPYTVC